MLGELVYAEATYTVSEAIDHMGGCCNLSVVRNVNDFSHHPHANGGFSAKCKRSIFKSLTSLCT